MFSFTLASGDGSAGADNLITTALHRESDRLAVLSRGARRSSGAGTSGSTTVRPLSAESRTFVSERHRPRSVGDLDAVAVGEHRGHAACVWGRHHATAIALVARSAWLAREPACPDHSVQPGRPRAPPGPRGPPPRIGLTYGVLARAFEQVDTPWVFLFSRAVTGELDDLLEGRPVRPVHGEGFGERRRQRVVVGGNVIRTRAARQLARIGPLRFLQLLRLLSGSPPTAPCGSALRLPLPQ